MQDDQGWLDHSLIQCYLSSVVEEGDKQWKKKSRQNVYGTRKSTGELDNKNVMGRKICVSFVEEEGLKRSSRKVGRV